MAIYDSLGKAPPTVDFLALRSWRWPGFWREAIDLAQGWWDSRREDIDAMQAELEEHMTSFVRTNAERELVMLAGGRSTRNTVRPMLPPGRQPRARLEYFERLGWPNNPLLRDNDAFSINRVGYADRNDWFWWIEEVRPRSGLRISEKPRYATREEAEADFEAVVKAFLEKRDFDKRLKAAAARKAKQTARRSAQDASRAASSGDFCHLRGRSSGAPTNPAVRCLLADH